MPALHCVDSHAFTKSLQGPTGMQTKKQPVVQAPPAPTSQFGANLQPKIFATRAYLRCLRVIQDAICLSFGAGAQRPEAFVCIAYFSRYGRRLGDLFHGLLSFFSRTRERRAGHDYCEPTRRLCQIKQDSSHDDGTLSDREMGGME